MNEIPSERFYQSSIPPSRANWPGNDDEDISDTFDEPEELKEEAIMRYQEEQNEGPVDPQGQQPFKVTPYAKMLLERLASRPPIGKPTPYAMRLMELGAPLYKKRKMSARQLQLEREAEKCFEELVYSHGKGIRSFHEMVVAHYTFR